MNTQQQATGGSTQIKSTIAVSESVNASFLGMFGKSATYTETDTVTETNTWLDTLTTTQTI